MLEAAAGRFQYCFEVLERLRGLLTEAAFDHLVVLLGIARRTARAIYHLTEFHGLHQRSTRDGGIRRMDDFLFHKATPRIAGALKWLHRRYRLNGCGPR